MTRSPLAVTAVAGPAVSVALVALLHVFQPEMSNNDALSEYALGDYGFLMNAAFVAAGIGFAALAGLLARRLTPTRSARTAIVLLAVAAVGWLLLGAGNVDPEGAKGTTHGFVHGIGFVLGFPAMFLALLLLARAFGRDERWAPFRRTLLPIAAAAVVVFALAFSDVASAVTFRFSEFLVMLGVALTAMRVAGTQQTSS
jgi:hypothetical protein